MRVSERVNALFDFEDPEAILRIRDVFATAGYTDGEILTALKATDISTIRVAGMPLLQYRTSGGTSLDTLIHLFLMRIPCNLEAARKALRPMDLETWADAGLVRIRNETVIATVEVLPYKGLLLAYDPPEMLQTPQKEHYVMGVGSSTITLDNLTIRKRFRRTLDLGTGNGIHALLASGHSDQVTGVDLNGRAVAFAKFNAELNQLSNTVFVRGDLFEPVRDQKFDLVVSNPPFVISPETRYAYRDGGMASDGVTLKIVREVPNYLHEGGFCQMLCNWAVKAGEPWNERLQGWFEGTGCDAWVLCSKIEQADEYAAKWIQHTEKDDMEGHEERLHEWMRYYEEQNIAAVCSGIIVMRRSTRHPNWFRWEDTPERMLGSCGNSVLRGFELQDFLQTVNKNEDLLQTRVVFSPHLRLEMQSVPSPDGWVDETIRIHQTKGLAYSGNIDRFIANLIIDCKGEQTLKEHLEKMADSMHKNPCDILPVFCHIARMLIEKGYLLPETGMVEMEAGDPS